MARLPTTLLPRSLPSSSSSSSSSSAPCTLLTACARPTATPRPYHHLLPATATTAITQQVRHATEVTRPKRPYTWTQIVQLSDGSTYTTRSTSPLPVYRSTKDTRNHLTWQPSEVSLQNVEVDEAGRLASFRQRFGTGYELAGASAAASETRSAAEVAAAEKSGDDVKKGKKARAAEAARAAKMAKKAAVEPEVVEEAAPAVSEEDSFESLMRAYVRDQPNLKGGQVAAKVSAKKGKKK